ncbi:MAG: N-acetylmuramoyl-L-alanine amidase [Elainella sp. C42_A2020_010]|nr:N-acetylmuramoyl-L-alanine amidase [Elainella sp. C42_A2020_010]
MPRVSALMMMTAVLVDCLALMPVAQAIETNQAPNPAAHQTALASPVAQAPLRPPITRPNRSNSGNRRPASSSSQEEFRYRLVVEGSSDSLLRQVRRVVPDAFRAWVDGRRVIQAGLFVTRAEAEAIQQQIEEINLEAAIWDLEQTVTRPSVRSSSSSFPARLTSGSNRTGYNYRLIVQGSSDSLLRQVRAVVPDAFRTTIAGERVIQAGLFVNRAEAEAIQQQLSRIRATTNIFDVGYGVAQASAPVQLPRVQSGRVVVIVDPGHGGRDPGAVGIGGIHEADIVLDISQQVASLLEDQGVQAVLTRQDDREIDLAPRVNLAESVNADLFVSIHANAISMSRPDVNGIETYYYDTGAALAASIHNSLVNATGMNDRGVRQARFYVLTRTSMPAVLVEVGFVTGQEDAAKLNSAATRSQIAAGIAQGILRYIQQRL